MEKGFTKFNEHTVEERSALIDRLIKVAESNALDYGAYLRGEYDSDDQERASVHLTTISDFRLAMEKIRFDKETIEDCLAHENAHANKAETLKIEPTYLITVLRKGAHLFGQVAVKTDIRHLPPEERRLARIAITSAPEEYGNELSESDRDKIERLKRER